jgi:hypothetical protein
MNRRETKVGEKIWPKIAGENTSKPGRSRIARALAAFDPTLPRLGRLQRQAKRCLIANDGSATTTQIRAWCYPGRERQHWHHAEIRRALRKLGAHQIGRSPTGVGRPSIWALEPYTENPSK